MPVPACLAVMSAPGMTAPEPSTTVPARVWLVPPCARARPGEQRTVTERTRRPNRKILRFISSSILTTGAPERTGMSIGFFLYTRDPATERPRISKLRPSRTPLRPAQSREWENLHSVPISGQAGNKNRARGEPTCPASVVATVILDFQITGFPDFQMSRLAYQVNLATSWMTRLEFSCTAVMR